MQSKKRNEKKTSFFVINPKEQETLIHFNMKARQLQKDAQKAKHTINSRHHATIILIPSPLPLININYNNFYDQTLKKHNFLAVK